MIGRNLAHHRRHVPFLAGAHHGELERTIEVLPASVYSRRAFLSRACNGSGPTTWTAIWWTSAAGMTAMIATLLFLRVWQPKRIWRFEEESARRMPPSSRGKNKPSATLAPDRESLDAVRDSFFVRALVGLAYDQDRHGQKPPLPAFSKADGKCRTCTKPFRARNPWSQSRRPENAKFDFNWLTAVGTGCFLAAMLSGFFLGLAPEKYYTFLGARCSACRFGDCAMT